MSIEYFHSLKISPVVLKMLNIYARENYSSTIKRNIIV